MKFEVSEGIFMEQKRVVMPMSLRILVLTLLHERHFGVVSIESFVKISVSSWTWMEMWRRK